jgi:competence protein ComEA
MHRLAVAILLGIVLAPTALRRSIESPAPIPPCRPEGRGVPPRGWLGCASAPGPERPLEDEERLVLGLPLDPNATGARGLAFVPGLSPRIAAEVVRDRGSEGPFASVEDLLRVHGIGPKRLALARSSLRVGLPP